MVSFRSNFSLGRRSPFCHGPNAGDHFTGSLSVTNDVADSFTGFVQLGVSPASQRRQALPLLTMPDQRLVDFMRDRSGQFPHHAHPVYVREICLDVAQPLTLFFGALAVFDVRRIAIPPDDLSVFDRAAAHREPESSDTPHRQRNECAPRIRTAPSSKGRAPLLRLTRSRSSG